MRLNIRPRLTLLLTLSALGCAPDAAAPIPAAIADAPLSGKADGLDTADRGCQIVLREVARTPAGPGFETTDGGQWLWRGSVAVSGPVDDAEVRVLYRSTAEPGWWSVPATAVGSEGDVTRFAFTLDDHVFGPGLSGTGLARSTIELIPYLVTGRSRRFDHNRVPGDLDTYRLTPADGWSVTDDPAVCPARVGPAPAWMGNVMTRISREGGHLCDGGGLIARGFTYDTWARQRAVVRSLCFEVWAPGITDFANPGLWRQLDVQMHTRHAEDEPFRAEYVSLLDQPGNNARYRVDLRALDPFEFARCPEGPVRRGESGYDEADLFFYFTVNGAELRPEGGGEFHGTFADYPDNAWRAANCP